MGEGLKKVARLCGGLTATDQRGHTVNYDQDSQRLPHKPRWRTAWEHLHDYPSSPSSNLPEHCPEVRAIMTKIALARRKTSLAFHKEQLGRQDFCWTGTYRHYIWEFWAEKRFLGRVYVSKRGAVPEVAVDKNVPWPGFTMEHGSEFMQAYLTALGLGDLL